MDSDLIRRIIQRVLLIMIILLIPACSPLWGEIGDVGVNLSRTEIPTNEFSVETLVVTATTETQTNTPPDIAPVPSENTTQEQVWFSGSVPIVLVNNIISNGLINVEDPARARLHMDVITHSTEPQTTWIYALVAPFPTIIDNVQVVDLINAWHGVNNGPFAGIPLWVDQSTLEAFSTLWGTPAFGSVYIGQDDSLIDAAWANQPAWGIVPFEDLEPRWKVLGIDGQSPLSREFSIDAYPLKINFGFLENEKADGIPWLDSNRKADKLTVLVMTGVTALVRATAAKMERNGVLYPGRDIRNWLRGADLTHVSNEIPFSENCPYPDPYQTTLVFCSDPKYISLLEDIGTDIVELTGNHFQDWGSDATLATLEMYNQRGWLYFGGGANLADAQAAKTIIHNGNKLAFIGCNPAGPQYAWATDDQPGAAPCDFDSMGEEIERLKSEGYLPIVTFQYVESYSITPSFEQVEDFHAMEAAGAVIVSGSQAHLPQSMELLNGSFIHYGLGNLFFDQMDFPVVGTRREFIDRHIFYNGKYIGTELLTAILEDYSRPRPMLPEERAVFLEEIFSASGW
jgi:hypothetical protein